MKTQRSGNKDMEQGRRTGGGGTSKTKFAAKKNSKGDDKKKNEGILYLQDGLEEEARTP